MSSWSMSWWTKACFTLLQLPVSILVKSKPIPTDPIEELAIDRDRPVLYVLPYHSKVDLLVLRGLCKKFNLPDPLAGIELNGYNAPAFLFIDKGPHIFASANQKQRAIAILTEYIAQHQQYRDIDVQMLPVTVMFGRAPDKEGKKRLSLEVLGGTGKFFKMLVSGRDCYTRFSKTVSLQKIATTHEDIPLLARKLARVARIHFSRQRMAAVGPQLPNRQAMLKKLLLSPVLSEAIKEEAKSKNIPLDKASKNALSMLNEIAANFTYRALRITDMVLTWAWHRLYQGLKITNADPVRELAQKGYEIVYAPCHRSHMDYLLLSYVLYRQGLVPPHIAAGINLNFWPAGPIFRRLGAFFIRRSFRGNKLYTAVFREYLAELFIRGYSVEYFIEGGRSRTGRLLDPKTGMITMTLQTLLKGDVRPIAIVPVYIGYEHVLEVATYANELRGAAKQKESLWQTLKAFCKLKKLGYGYVNFGQPIALNQFLNQQVPDWQSAIDPNEAARPSWLTPTANVLATQVMQHINYAAATNAMNLCCSILLAADQRALSKVALIEYLDFTLLFLREVPYSPLVTIPTKSAEALFEHVKGMGKFVITKDDAGEIVSFSQEQAILMTYYRNNIQHITIIPAMIARIIFAHKYISKRDLSAQLLALFPLVKAELFIYYDTVKLMEQIDAILRTFEKISLIDYDGDNIVINQPKASILQLVASIAKETLQRYTITFSLLTQSCSRSRGELEKESRLIAERLSLLHGINAPEFFDKVVFSTLISTLKELNYLDNETEIAHMYSILKPLISNRVLQTIEATVQAEKIITEK